MDLPEDVAVPFDGVDDVSTVLLQEFDESTGWLDSGITKCNARLRTVVVAFYVDW